jgi:hypothetical protein
MRQDDFQRIAEAMLDGTAGERDREAFAAHIASDPGARAAWDDLLATREPLARASLEPLPPGLHGAIVRAARAQSEEPGRRASWLHDLFGALNARPLATAGATFAMGLALGVVGFATYTGGMGPGGAVGSRVSGTMGSGAPHAASATLHVDGARVELRAGSDGATYRVHAVAAAERASEIRLAWDPAALHCDAVRWPGAIVGPATLNPGELVISLERTTTWELTLAPTARGPHDVHVSIRSGADRGERVLRLSP